MRKLLSAVMETSWRYRRIAVFGVLVWSFSILTYLATFGVDTTLTRAIVDTLGWTIMATVAWYVGGATVDDLNRMRHGRLPDPQTFDPLPAPPRDDAPVRRDLGGEQ